MVLAEKKIARISNSEITGIESQNQISNFETQLSPNPAIDWLHWHLDSFESKESHPIKIYDMQGKLILQFGMDAQDFKIDTSTLPAGLYLVQFYHSEKVTYSRFLKTNQ